MGLSLSLEQTLRFLIDQELQDHSFYFGVTGGLLHSSFCSRAFSDGLEKATMDKTFLIFSYFEEKSEI
jgi:hypothetical protein